MGSAGLSIRMQHGACGERSRDISGGISRDCMAGTLTAAYMLLSSSVF